MFQCWLIMHISKILFKPYVPICHISQLATVSMQLAELTNIWLCILLLLITVLSQPHDWDKTRIRQKQKLERRSPPRQMILSLPSAQSIDQANNCCICKYHDTEFITRTWFGGDKTRQKQKDGYFNVCMCNMLMSLHISAISWKCFNAAVHTAATRLR